MLLEGLDRVPPERDRPHCPLRLRWLERAFEHGLANGKRAGLEVSALQRRASSSPIRKPVPAMRMTCPIRFCKMQRFAEILASDHRRLLLDRLRRELHVPCGVGLQIVTPARGDPERAIHLTDSEKALSAARALLLVVREKGRGCFLKFSLCQELAILFPQPRQLLPLGRRQPRTILRTIRPRQLDTIAPRRFRQPEVAYRRRDRVPLIKHRTNGVRPEIICAPSPAWRPFRHSQHRIPLSEDLRLLHRLSSPLVSWSEAAFCSAVECRRFS